MADSAADDAGGQNEAIELKETDLQKKLKSAKKGIRSRRLYAGCI